MAIIFIISSLCISFFTSLVASVSIVSLFFVVVLESSIPFFTPLATADRMKNHINININIGISIDNAIDAFISAYIVSICYSPFFVNFNICFLYCKGGVFFGFFKDSL